MLSREADAVYWMTRYIERAENIARLLDVNLRLQLDSRAPTDQQWQPLVMIMADRTEFEARYKGYSRVSVFKFLAFDALYGNSMLSCLRAARENARSIREVISSEMWEQINLFYLMVSEAAGADSVIDTPGTFLAQVRTASHQFLGVTEATMPHGEAWQFSRLGTLIERADKTTRILDVKYFILMPDVAAVGTAEDHVQWAAVLRSASAWEAYLKHGHLIEPVRIAEFLLLNREFPRSVQHCLSAADYALHAISRSPQGTFTTDAERHLGLLRAELSFTNIEDIVTGGLHQYLDGVQERINTVASAIHTRYFT
ncbi:MAG: alpha-E domain-containing protein [Lentisphaerae bacterium]|nr:alpha-E domain-containing protein [Lentisphaerota bacterium]